MINISKSGNAIKFVFTDSDHYLYGNGEIEVPVNSLSLIVDESNMVTFKKAATSDPFISFRADNSNLGTKAAIEQFYKENMVGSTGGGSGSGVTPSKVQEMIDESISGKADTAVVNQIAEQTTQSITALSGDVQTKQDALTAGQGIDITNNVISSTVDITVDPTLDSGSTNPVQNAVITQALNEKADASALTAHTADTNVHFTDNQKSNYDDLESQFYDYDGWDVMSQSVFNDFISNDYSTVIGQFNERIDENTSNITAVVNDVSTVSGQVQTKVATSDFNTYTAATASAIDGKQDVLSAGTGIEISGNVISATGGGGATYSAGTNISIDTANTINCTLNARNGSGAYSLIIGDSECSATRNYSIAVGHNADAIGNTSIVIGSNSSSNAAYSFVHGTNCTVYDSASNATHCFIFGNQIKNIKKSYNTAFGDQLSLSNNYETAFGTYNNSVTGSTASGQTLFSVGNGISNNARHNAFEIRQNGDIYVNDGTNDVRLQDTILALGGLKLVKLTQAEYDQLATKDPDTLYIISNVVS